ncbi:MAG: ASKHA domain-containing protein [Planctomycetota bacterium]
MGRIYFPQYRKGRDGIDAFEGTILEHAQRLGVEIASDCGGLGTCGRCVVRIERGADALGERTAAEQDHSLGPDQRLACQAVVQDTAADVEVFVRDFGDYSILADTLDSHVDRAPAVHQAGNRVMHADEGDLGPYRGETYGLAIDVGTTTLVMQLVDLEDGRTVATLSRKNPQISYGNDVISRIGFTMEHERGLQELQACVVTSINEQLADFAAEHGEFRDKVYEVVVVGNSTMRELFFGQDVSTLGVIPYQAAELGSRRARARTLGLKLSPSCVAYGAALIGGHAGADALADIVACGMYHDEAVNLLIDIGTNGEVAVGNRHKIMTASCAAGGAYEGATIRCGTGAIAGAIKNIWLHDEHVDFETIGNKPPVGICGSGLIDLLAELLRTGRMSRKAKVREDFRVTDEIGLSQQDIYQLITAKAGLRADQDLLIQYYGVELAEIGKIYLAGGFGNFINPENAVAIGLLPPAADKIVRLGNGALAGARTMLLSHPIRQQSEQVARDIEHVRPNEREPDFQYLVADRMYF